MVLRNSTGVRPHIGLDMKSHVRLARGKRVPWLP
jgi:hypothetical protein